MIKTMRLLVFVMSSLALLLLTNCSDSERVAALEKELQQYKGAEATVQKNIALFKELDLEAFNNRDWKRIKEIHSEDVVAYGADASVSDGMVTAHEDDLKFLFESFPDYTIESHSVDFGQGEWTAGLSTAGGTFTAPMKLKDGRIIQPNGKKMILQAITLARWENGRIKEEYIFWDNLTMFGQLGIVDQVMGEAN